MPFTLAHPAAAVPFTRLRLPFGALVVGALVPDFRYALLFGPGREVTHTPASTLWFSLPVGLLVLVAVRRLCLDGWLATLPAPIRSRVPAPGRSNLARDAAGVWVGALSHVVLDAFTHLTSPLVQGWAPLRAEVLRLQGQRLEVFNLLQHGGTVVGLLLLAYWIRRWMRNTEPGRGPRRPAAPRGLFALLIGAPIVVGLAAAVPQVIEFGVSVLAFTTGAREAGFTVLPALVYAWLVIPTAWWWLRGRTRAREGESA